MEIALDSEMRTLMADGVRKAVEGHTTVDEVLRVLSVPAVLICLRRRRKEYTMGSFTIQDALALNELAGRLPIDLSSDGRWLAYTTRNHTHRETAVDGYTRNGVPEEVVRGVVWVTNVQKGTRHCLTPDWGSSWAGRWSPDGKRLAFFSDKNGEPHLFVWHRETDEMQSFPEATARPFFEFEVPKWSPDGRLVFYKALPHGQPLAFSREPEQQHSRAQEPFVEVWHSRPDGTASNVGPDVEPFPGPTRWLEPTD